MGWKVSVYTQSWKSPVVLLSHFFDDLKRWDPGVTGLDRDLETIKRRVENEGEGFLFFAFNTFAESFDKGLDSGILEHIPGFKTIRNGSIPRFLSGMVLKVFSPSGYLLEAPCLMAISNIRQLVRMFKKTVMSSEIERKLDSDARSSFETTDELLVEQQFEDRSSEILRKISGIVFADLGFVPDSEETISRRHGPGAVFERTSPNGKWNLIWSYFSGQVNSPYDTLDWFQEDQGPPSLETRISSGSRLVTVPKSTRARRTITVEGCVAQFVQQGLNASIRNFIRKNKILSTCLDLDSQKPNQELALLGSRTGEWCTIDLSSASDLLSNKLVNLCFSGAPEFLSELQSCRSINVKGLQKPLAKYAGMGNATTFPIQSITFSMLCMGAVLDCVGRVPTHRGLLHAAKAVRVFGDDIIVKSEYFDQVRRWIEAFGLRLNLKKSFWSGKFRESCGVDAYAGVDITPAYLRCHPSSLVDSKTVGPLVSFSNNMWDRGFLRTSDYVRRIVDGNKPLPCVSRSSSVLGWHSRQDMSFVTGWSKRLQCLTISGIEIGTRKRPDLLDGVPALLKFFHTSLIEREKGHLERSSKKFDTFIRKATRTIRLVSTL